MVDKTLQNKIIVKRIIELMNERNLNVNQLAKVANIRQSNISNLINGGNIPTIPTLIMICEGLEITLHEFFDIEEYNKKEALLQASDR